MTRPLVDQIADAVLYEGYMLYPYRPTSVKNRQRWTFGGLFPQDCDLVKSGLEPSQLRAECLLEGAPHTTVRLRARFLHLIVRSLAGRPWQEAEDREVVIEAIHFGENGRHEFAFAGRYESDGNGGLREQLAIRGAIEWSWSVVSEGVSRLSVRVVNLTPPPHPDGGREELLSIALVSTHAILEVTDGEFVSAIDPPDQHRHAAAECQNVGVWPVLVGAAGDRHTMLASPIILYDHPEIAPESPGDLFDATEIDEILTLRILTMTDDEKREMRAADPRADALLSRTEALGQTDMMRLHGAMRGARPVMRTEESA